MSYLGDVPINEVKAQNLRACLAYLRTEYTPRRLSGRTEPLSPKTIRNVYITLSSLFSWLQREFGGDNPMKTIPSPDYAVAEVEPFTQAELEALLKAVDYCEPAETHGRQSFTMRRRTALRDRTLLLFLLDTGLRVSELCVLNIGDVDQKSGKVTVKHGAEGGAKGGKGRLVYLGKSARRVLWRYRVTREDSHEADAPLFLAGHRRLRRDALRQLTASLGEKAQVKDCHPHRFRHTFAITFLRSGGDVFTLQSLLGHATLEMVQHYARIAQVDVEQAHRLASPADNWRL